MNYHQHSQNEPFNKYKDQVFWHFIIFSEFISLPKFFSKKLTKFAG